MTPTLTHKDCCYIALARYLRKRKRNSGSSSNFTYFNFKTVARLVCLKGFPNVTSKIKGNKQKLYLYNATQMNYLSHYFY